ncbi:MAG: 50S ribosome-binding GTPase, partial [Butyrivibrio sp.]|nr:50S ribosome-binding GTPase [Butyrivibrio sp.]
KISKLVESLEDVQNSIGDIRGVFDGNSDDEISGKIKGSIKPGIIKESMDTLIDSLEKEIDKMESEDDKKRLSEKINLIKKTKTNILIVGSTGSGKSSTINALFSCENKDTDDYVEYAKVGTKASPETKAFEKYTLGNLTLWDSPGLGDSPESDEETIETIKELLEEKDDDGNLLIDIVLLVVDGTSKDLGMSYKLLNEALIPVFEEDTDRIIIGLNQADIAMKTGRHWDYELNKPDEVLIKFLEEKVQSIHDRIMEDSGLDIMPIYYCAGYKEPGGEIVRPYNLSKLLMYILEAIPEEKRIPIMEGINTESENYRSNDDDDDYNEKIVHDFTESYDSTISECVDAGAEIGQFILGVPGAIVGSIIGGSIGLVKSIFEELF